MNIKILHSWLKDYLETKASPQKIAEALSLASVSIERIEKYGDDYIYDIEVTTNRPDLLSVVGLAREAGAVLPEFDIDAKFKPLKLREINNKIKLPLEIKVDPKLVNRICAIALEFSLKESPKKIRERLETSEINPHNNVIDVTNYVMREIGHPMHAFDLDKLLLRGKMIIREAKLGEPIQTLDGVSYTLPGGDIIIDDGTGRIIDLMAIKGTQNSAIDDNTKRVLLFVDNNDTHRIRKTSMTLGIRTDAAQMNEKGVDRELARDTVLRGVELLHEIGDAKVISELIDIYPNKLKPLELSVNKDKINKVIGIDIPLATSAKILSRLGFEVAQNENKLKVKVPSYRLGDIEIEEDLIEEIARVYGYHKLPSLLPTFDTSEPYNLSSNRFFWEQKVKEFLKYTGFTEIYTYSMVGENMLEVAIRDAVTIKNPLDQDHVYMRTTLIPSLLEAVRENKNREELAIFELANVYHKRPNDLPKENLRLGAIFKKPKASFFDMKGIAESLLNELGIEEVEFKKAESGAAGASVYIWHELIGEIEMLDDDLVDFELDFDVLLKYVTLKKVYKPISKFPESTEDLRFEIDEKIEYAKIENAIKSVSKLIKQVSLLDVYQNKKTFRIVYQSKDRNLTSEDLSGLRSKITAILKTKFKAEPA